jgi:hypothetical protein
LLGAGLTAAAALAAPRRARAIGPGAKFRIGQLTLGATAPPRASAVLRLLGEVDKRTSIDTDRNPVATSLTSPTLHETPFLYLAGDREFAVPSPAGDRVAAPVPDLRRLPVHRLGRGHDRRRLRSSRCARCARRCTRRRPPASRSCPAITWSTSRSTCSSDRSAAWPCRRSSMEGITRGGRLTVAYAQNDLGGAWAKDNLGNWDFPCEPGGERQRELAYRMGVNLVMYALCLDYKTDQVHVPFIMRRRRWRPDDGAQTPPKP